MKICKSYKRKEIWNKVNMIFSCDKYDKIWREALDNTNEVGNTHFQARNKKEKLKLFLPKIFYILLFRQFLVRAFELRKHLEKIRRN